MRTAIIAIAFLSGTTAFAQDQIAPPPTDTATPAEAPTSDATEPLTTTTPAPVMAVASTGSVQAPGNASPERDARGIAVISDAATVPAGYNGTPDALNGTGGPLVDPADISATAEPAARPDASYPACSRTVTDNCVQTYERHRQR